jgi:uncharacterized protein (DUF305 family)
VRRRTHARKGSAVLLLAALLSAGCSSGGDDATGTSARPEGRGVDRDITVLQPGKPGEAARTVEPGGLPTENAWNHADVAFMQMMVPHHAQALEMSRLASDRAEDERVLAMARRIRGAQGPEIIEMSGWLDARQIDVPKAGEDPSEYDHGAHGHGSMAGMLTEKEMTRLRSSRGRAFDRLFLESMIGHHRGAVAMAQDVAREGTDVRVAEVAADVAAGQSAEIQRMLELLRQL